MPESMQESLETESEVAVYGWILWDVEAMTKPQASVPGGPQHTQGYLEHQELEHLL